MDLRRVSVLVLAVGLLTACGTDGDAGDGASPAATIDTRYGAPADTSGSPASSSTTSPAPTSATATDEAAAPAAEVVVVISDFSYQLPDSVPAGATITVRNEDGVGHTVTSDDDGATFDVAVGPGEEATFTAPAQAGEFPFHCRPHPNMTATLVVEG